MIDQKIDPINTKLDKLEKTQNEMKADIAGLKQDMVRVKADIRKMNGNIAVFENDHGEKLNGLEAGIQNVCERFRRQDQIEEKLEDIETKSSAVWQQAVSQGWFKKAKGF